MIDTTTQGRRANLLVRRGRPGYDRMVARAQSGKADPAEWKWVPEGIKVPLAWWVGDEAAIVEAG
jgi:hypothetical protein